MKKIVLTIIVFTTISIGAVAQVGIGNATPDSNSVLDLTNPNDKGFLLPHAQSSSFANFSTQEGMLYYYQNNIFYRTSYGYNALSPWKYKVDGSSSNHLFFGGGYVGLGFTNTSTPPDAPLHIISTLNLSLSAPGIFMLGAANSSNLVLDRNELQARSNGSAATLSLNAQGGNVIIGNNTSTVTIPNELQIETLKAKKVQQKSGSGYYDLVPVGTIVMYYQSSPPPGWAICNGGTHARSDGSGWITTPNLRGKFIVAAGASGYVNGSTGGDDKYTLAENQMPSHTHGKGSLGTSSAGSHSHSKTYNQWSSDANHGVTAALYYHSRSNSKVEYTGAAGNHTHTISGTTASTGGTDDIDNRPAYYALVYIMKL